MYIYIYVCVCVCLALEFNYTSFIQFLFARSIKSTKAYVRKIQECVFTFSQVTRRCRVSSPLRCSTM